jgi:hypothetical protein
MLRIAWPTVRWSKFVCLMLHVCATLTWSAFSQAQTACSKSEALYDAAQLANIKIFGKYVTLPPEPEWESLVPLYNQLKDHDTSVHLGDCKGMMVVLKQKVVERVKKYGTTLSVSIEDPLNRLQGKGRITLNGAPIRVQAEAAPTIVLPGTHRVALTGLVLQPGERLALTTELDGTTVAKGEASELDIELPRAANSNTRHHSLTFRIAAQHECRVRLNVNGNLLNRPKPGKPSFIVELSNQKLFTRQLLQKGDYPLSEGAYALTIKLQDGALPEGVQPRLLVDDAQIGLKPVTRDEVPTWQHTLRIGCIPGQGSAVSKINLGFSGEKPLLEADPEAVEKSEPNEPSKPLPTWTWVGIGAVGVGAAVGLVSYFGVSKPAVQEGDETFKAENCRVQCSDAAKTYITNQYDKASIADGVAIGGIVLAGVGAVVGSVAWFTSDPPKNNEAGDEEAFRFRVVPIVGRTLNGARLVGTF